MNTLVQTVHPTNPPGGGSCIMQHTLQESIASLLVPVSLGTSFDPPGESNLTNHLGRGETALPFQHNGSSYLVQQFIIAAISLHLETIGDDEPWFIK